MSRGHKRRAVTPYPPSMQDGQSLARAVTAPVEADVAALSAAFADHSARHQNGGADEISVAGLSGTLADPQTPTAHASSHENGGGDELDITTLGGFPGGSTNFLREDGTFQSVGSASGRWEPLANGLTAAPALIFALGDVVMVFIP